jgi:hypothetical protein
VYAWIRTELRAGRGADPALAARLITRLAVGHADRLGGCHLSVHDDLDAIWPARTTSAPAISYAARQDLMLVTGPLRLGLDATQRGRRHEHQPPRGAQPGTRAGCSPARCTSGVSAVISSLAARQCLTW